MSLNKGTILVVDDSIVLLKQLKETLEAEGYAVKAADSGRLALASIPHVQPELIFLDVHMPEMGGFEVCERLKAQKEQRDIPVIFISGVAEVEDQVKGLQLGAVDFISKPFQRDELLARTQTHLKLRRLSLHLEEQVLRRTEELRQVNERLEYELAERKMTEQAHRESEQRFRFLAENAPDAIARLDSNLRFIYINPTVARILDMPPAKIVGQNIQSLGLPNDVLELHLAHFQTVFMTGKPAEMEFQLPGPRGLTFHEMRTEPEFDHRGRVIAAIAVTRDITKRKQMEEDTRRSEQQQRLIINTIPNMLWTALPDGSFDYCNTYWLEYTGLSLEYFQSNGWQNVIYPQDMEYVMAAWQQALCSGTIYESEHRIRHRSGEFCWFLIRAAPLHDEAGNVIKWYGSCTDITELKRVEKELKRSQKMLHESEHRLREVIELVPQLIWTATPDGAADYLSRQWVEYTGIAETMQLGDGWIKPLHPDDRPRVLESWQKTVAHQQETFDIEYRLRNQSGEYRWFKTRALPLRDSAGKIIKWFGSATDIHDLKQLEQELREAKHEAEAANFAKTRYLAAISHDLRSPLNAIIGFSELTLLSAEEGQLSPTHVKNITQVAESGRHLLNLVESLMNISAIESGKVKLNRELVEMGGVIEKVIKTHELMATHKGVSLSSESGVARRKVFADQHRLIEIFNNLISNALKYTPSGGSITLGMREDRNEMIMFVKDTGEGIDQEDLELIFTPFEQGRHSKRHGADKNLGLGLSICQQLVKLHGGRIWVESVKHQGSCFYFTLPYI
jgi:PAS domain S-box-containing protein